MTGTVIGGTVGARLANDVNVDDIQDPTDTGDISGASYLGALRDHSGSCSSYKEIIGADGITVSNMGNMNQTITPTADVHDLEVYIKDNAEGSFKVPMYILNSSTQVDGWNLIYAMENLPNGATGTIGNGSPGTADEAAEYNPWEDTTSNYGFGDGYTGYNFVVEKSYTNSSGTTKYFQIFFDNCFLTPQYGVNAQAVDEVTVEFKGRRTRVIQAAASSVLA